MQRAFRVGAILASVGALASSASWALASVHAGTPPPVWVSPQLSADSGPLGVAALATLAAGMLLLRRRSAAF